MNAGAFRRLLARVLLVVGIAVAAVVLLPAVPHDQTIVFRLPSRDVAKLSATLRESGDDEAVSGLSLSFDDIAPREVRHHVSLPKGEYVMAIDLTHRIGTAAETSFERRVSLQGGETTVFVEDSKP